MMKIFCPNWVEYRDIYFAKISQRRPHIEFFISFIFVTEGALFLNKDVCMHVFSIFMQ